MLNAITQGLFWLRRRSFFRVAQRTFVMLMPVATLGAYFKILRDCIFSPDSLIYNLFNFDYSMSDKVWNMGNALSSGMVQVTFGIFGIYATYFAAVYTARLYHKDATMAGITAVLVITFCAYLTGNNGNSSNQLSFYSRILNINGVLIALVIGYLVGQVFHWLGKDYVHIKYEHVAEIQKRAWDALKPTIVTILFGILLGLTLFFFKIRLLDSNYVEDLITQLRSSNNLAIVVPLTVLAMLSWWCGMGYPLQSLMHANNSGAALVNLNYALRHGNASNVPYKYLGSSLVRGYGLMGDAAIFLTIAVVLLIFSENKEQEAVTKLNLLPTAFGAKNGLAFGIPIILNPLYLLPIIIIPALNELIAALGISLHLIMPTVYPVLEGTPGILISFFGSNGNWPSFIFTIILFILDILVLIPFIMIGRKINEELRKYDQAEIQS